MREILFRGKRIDNSGWVEGLLTAYTDRIAQIGTFTDFKHCVRCDGAFGVTPSTVGQYIGLTDKNGKKIFEGDILKGRGRHVFRVEYYVPTSSFVARETYGVPYRPSLNTGTMTYYEVIGNIHDNPELWKEYE